MLDINPVWEKQIEYECQIKDLDKYVIQAICYCESRYKEDAKGGECIGLMQIHPCWSKGRDLSDPLVNIQVGTEVYRYYIDTYETDISALNHYNSRNTDELTSYSEKVLSVAEDIYMRQKKSGYVEEI